MTVTSIGSLNPANDPESMVAFLPNVRLNSMDRGAGQEIDMRYTRIDRSGNVYANE